MRRRSVILAGVSSMALAAMRGPAILAGVSLRLPLARAASQPGVLVAAADALGVNEIKTLQFVASGTNFTVGQNFTPDDFMAACDVSFLCSPAACAASSALSRR